MSDVFVQIFLWLAGSYLGFGALFGAAFALWGAGRIDGRAADGPLGFKLLIVPGGALLWPVLLGRWRQAAAGTGPRPGGPVRAPGLQGGVPAGGPVRAAGLQGDESGAGGRDGLERRQNEDGRAHRRASGNL